VTSRARVFGDDINTDYIITSRRKRESLDPLVLRGYLFETLDPTFAATVLEGDVIVAGRNFGCGSAMEVAVTAIVGAGIRAVLARSFSRTYYRNAVNNGLLPVVCDTARIHEGDALEITDAGVRHLASGALLPSEPLPEIMRRIVDAGGLVGYIRKHAR
jgi:3-isopropylmalate/(R)-2-methylmalate dehydratase small subunit